MDLLTPSQIISATASSSPLGGYLGLVSLSGVALVASSVILAFLYMWAALFRNTQLNGYVKQELYELFVTGIIIILFYSLLAVLQNIPVSDFIPDGLYPKGVSQTTNIYDAVSMYYKAIDSDMAAWLNYNYIFNIYVDQVASVTPYSRPLGVGLVASPLAGFASPFKQLLYNSTVALSIAFIINHAQVVVYIFSLQAFLKYYLPLGLLLRSFTPTRRLGGTLIGLAMAFLFVFPALSLVSYVMLYGGSSGPLVSWTSIMSDYATDFLNGNITFNTPSGLTGLVTGALSGVGSILQSIVGTGFIGLMLLPIGTVSWAFTLGFIVPAFNILIFVQAAKVLSQSFGEEVDISSLTRMI